MQAEVPEPAVAEIRLWPGLDEVMATWQLFGPPCSVGGGGMVGVSLVDHRAALYPARRAYLDEVGLRGENREVLMLFWQALDEEEVGLVGEAVAKAMER